ncbi:MAG: DUF72 domain-containing protein, partial [Planctomycetota bacterium]
PRCPKRIERLATTLGLLPESVKAAFEFRDERWLEDDVFDLLRDHDCALCVSDTDDAPLESLPSTATWGYVRLRADHYTEDQLQAWQTRLESSSWHDAFVFFKHEAHGPVWAMKLAAA